MARGLAVMFDGDRLRRIRLAAHDRRRLTAEELAQAVGASKAQILAYENGLRVPDPPRIRALADALDVSPLELADQSGADEWDLAALRRATGLRASDLWQALGLKPHAYRRLETEGLTAEGRFGVVPQLASLLNVPVRVLENAIGNAPGVLRRLEEVSNPLSIVLTRYLEPSRLDLPQSDDALIRKVAALYRRPASTITKILAHEVLQLREMHRRRIVETANAYYGSTHDEQLRAKRRLRAEDHRITNAQVSLPQRVDMFFRSQLAPDHWKVLAKLHALRARRLTAREVLPALEDRAPLGPFVQPRASDGLKACEISREGQHHYAAFKAWYEVLYPQVHEELEAFEDLLAPGEPPILGHLQQRFAEAETVLFSFDGVLCRMFAGNMQAVSGHLAQAAHDLRLFTGPSSPTDPVAMLRSVVEQGSEEQIRTLNGILTSYELNAAQRAEPLPGAAQLLAALSRGPWRMAVVTDHASVAVQSFLSHLAPAATSQLRLEVFGRPEDPRLMKPNPHAVALATSSLGSDRTRTLLIGESVADALAARAAGVQFIGVAATRSRARMLRDAGAARVVETLDTLITAVTRCEAAMPGPTPQ
ncbi:helix-turn-helix domain-containing protein [Streptomyces aculeolatus]